MEDQSQNFFALAVGFVSLVDLMVVSGMWLSYLTAGRDYLKVACFAGLFEVVRHGIDFIATTSFASTSWYLVGQVFQFGSTLLFVAALLLIYETVTRFYYWAFSVLGLGMIGVFVWQLTYETPAPGGNGFFESIPLILLSLILLWRAIVTSSELTPGKLFMVLASLSVVSIRCVLSVWEMGDFYLLLYYMEYLSFTLLLIALVLYELEFAKHQIGELLADKTQSEQDLQFIVDNSLDVILVTDKVGLLQSWSAKASEIFGYTNEQAVGKIHMDDLFVSNLWGKDIEPEDEVQAKMESIDGKSFIVDVRMSEVEEAGGTYHLYVLRLVEEPTPTPGAV